ncbi:MAG: glycosyltransferase [Actinomycetota bacterium]
MSASPSEPKVSVIALAYDHERFVEESLDAVAAQTFRDFELIVVDDASTDGTADRIAAWLDRTGTDATFLHNEKNLGVSAARNLALRHCRGTYLCTAAGDDVYEPDRLEVQVATFDALGDDVAAVFGDMRVIDERGHPLPASAQRWSGVQHPSGSVFEELLRQNFVPSPATMLRRSAVEEVGGWDEGLILDDWDLFLRLADRHRLVHHREIVANYRQLDTGISRDPARAAERSASVVRLQLRWAGRGPSARRQAIDRSWRSALSTVEFDQAEGLRLLDEVLVLEPSPWRKAVRALAATPLGPHLVELRRTISRRGSH